MTSVHAARVVLAGKGYAPVPVYTGQKRPWGNGWEAEARPGAVPLFRPEAASTGIATRGLIVPDIDIDAVKLADRVTAAIEQHFGEPPVRRGRADSCRTMLFYRAAKGEPAKVRVEFPTWPLNAKGEPQALEIMGAGQQVVVPPSIHEDGAPYHWCDGPGLDEIAADELPAVDTEQVKALVETLCDPAAFGGVLKVAGGLNGHAHPAAGPRQPASDADVADAEAALLALDVRAYATAKGDGGGHDRFIEIARAAHAGGVRFETFVAWCSDHPKFQPNGGGEKWCETEWRSFAKTHSTTVATLYAEVFARRPGWRKPSELEAEYGPGQGVQQPPPGEPPPPDPPPGDPPQSRSAVDLDDFVAYMPSGTFLFTPTRQLWPGSSVNARVPPVRVPGRDQPVPASAWLARHRPVDQMTWAPGMPMLIGGRVISEGGWIERPGCTVFNQYRPPLIVPRRGDAGPWLNHIRRIYPDEAEHIIQWLAHRVQRPQEKINHALVLGGCQGIGKDTLLEPVKRAIGPWNFSEVSPQQMLGRFNGFVKSVVLRINEARDLGDIDRFAFYDHLKAYTAAPPDVLRCDEKHLHEYAVLNVCGVVITSNHKADGIFLPPDDRRHHVSWSTKTKNDFTTAYWNDLYGWFNSGGAEIVAGHLAALDLSRFDPKAPPPKTEAFWEIANANRASENAELDDALDGLGRPAAVTLGDLTGLGVDAEIAEWIKDRKNRRRVPHRLEECGYVSVRNAGAQDGLWKVSGKRQVVYTKAELSLRERLAAATARASR